MIPNIPEELEAMAFLIGQSNQIDSMMMERPSTLVTGSHTIKQGMNDYVRQQRSNQPPPSFIPPTPQELAQIGNSMYPQVPPPPVVNLPYVVAPPQNNDGQLELNLDPTKAEIIINLLKEISAKLTKQNSMIEKHYADQSKEKRISDAPIKLGKPS
jgi:hypothetical protein